MGSSMPIPVACQNLRVVQRRRTSGPVYLRTPGGSHCSLGGATTETVRSIEVEDLREGPHLVVRMDPLGDLEESGHLLLPALVDLPGGHPRTCLFKIRRLHVADEQPVITQKERIIVPARFPQRLKH